MSESGLDVYRLRELADHIEESESQLDQGEWSDLSWESMPQQEEPSCGTAACIAGHAAMLAGYVVVTSGDCYRPGDTQDSEPVGEANEIAGLWLGLGPIAASLLFTSDPMGFWPNGYAEGWHRMTESMRARAAARLLRDLASGKLTI